MADSDQSQGTGIPQSTDEALAEMKADAKVKAERSKTVSERLERLTTAGDNQPEPMPSSEEKQIEEATPQPETEKSQSQDAEQPTLPDSNKEEALANSKNPERTRAYIEKLEAELHTYKEERQKAAGDSVFDSLRPTVSQQPETNLPFNLNQPFNLTQQQTQAIAQNFVGADGTVDIEGLNGALKLANERAQSAELAAAHAQRIAQEANEAQQVREAHANFPQLDPKSDKFDPNFYDLTAITLAKSGMRMSLNQAAAEVAKRYKSAEPVNLDRVKDEAITEFKENQARREQGPIETSKGEPRAEVIRKDPYKRANVMDDPDIEARLKKAGILS